MNRFNQAPIETLSYRPDLNGLRALAVLAVIGFHYFPKSIPGGFIGVDVFFVISGYLISRILFSEMDSGGFSVIDFYVRRVRRIFPALILVLVFGLILGWFTLLADSYMQYGKHMFGGATFIDNILYFNEAGYFDGSALSKPLLHLWSLGIEEQFYLVWPLLLILIKKSRKNLLHVIAGLTILSFGLNIYTVFSNQAASFYLPLPRFWELLIGSLIAYRELYVNGDHSTNRYLTKKMVDFMPGAGLALMLFGVFFLNARSSFPGYWVLIPVVAGALLISSASDCLLNKKLLSNKVLVWIGLISYPLYLWHWVLLSFAYLVRYEPLPNNIKVVLLIASFLFASLTYHCVELPIKKYTNLKKLAKHLLFLILLAGLAGWLVYEQAGFPERRKSSVTGTFIHDLSGIQNSYTFFKTDDEWRYRSCHAPNPDISFNSLKERCVDPERPLIFLWGDSYAASFYSGLSKLRDEAKRSFGLAQFTNSNTPPFYLPDQRGTDWKSNNRTLFEINANKLALVEELKPKLVILMWKFDGERAYLNELPMTADQEVLKIVETISKIQSASPSTKAVVIGPLPHWKYDLRHVVAEYARDHGGNLPPLYMNYGMQDAPLQWDAFFKAQFLRLHIDYISAIDILCRDGKCLTRTDDVPEHLITVDYGHLSKAGAELLAEKIKGRLLHDLSQ